MQLTNGMNFMKRLYLTAAILSLISCAHGKTETRMTKAQLQEKIQSLEVENENLLKLLYDCMDRGEDLRRRC